MVQCFLGCYIEATLSSKTSAILWDSAQHAAISRDFKLTLIELFAVLFTLIGIVVGLMYGLDYGLLAAAGGAVVGGIFGYLLGPLTAMLVIFLIPRSQGKVSPAEEEGESQSTSDSSDQ